MAGQNRIFDDFAKLMTDAAGVAQGARREVEQAFRTQAEKMLNGMDVVRREDFDAVREMAARARDDNARLEARIAALEARLATAAPSVAEPTIGVSPKPRARKLPE